MAGAEVVPAISSLRTAKCLPLELRRGDDHPRDHEDHDQGLNHEPEAREPHPGDVSYSIRACRNAIATAWVRVSACSLPITRFVSDFTVSVERPIERATSSVW